MSDNQYKFKKRVAPEWYEDGPVKVFSKEEIDEWERTCDPKVWEKIEMQQGLSEKDIKWLDGLKQTQVEQLFEEIMEGTSGNEESNVT